MMNRVWIFMLAMACPAAALAQPARVDSEQYRPAIPPPSTYGGYGGWGYQGASTAAGSAMNGMANVVSAKGDYNLSTSAAAVNLTQAQSKEIQNRQQATSTYFAMRDTNTAERAKESGPKPTMQELARIAHEGVPTSLNPGQMDPTTGGLNWPDFLQEDMFKSQRAEVDQLFTKRAKNGGLSYDDRTTVHKVVAAMFSELKANIRSIEPPDYVDCRNFLNSVMYAATKNEL